MNTTIITAAIILQRVAKDDLSISPLMSPFIFLMNSRTARIHLSSNLKKSCISRQFYLPMTLVSISLLATTAKFPTKSPCGFSIVRCTSERVQVVSMWYLVMFDERL